MSRIGSYYARTTPLMLSGNLYARLRETQSELLQKQKEITTGKSVLRPSDAADKSPAILYLRERLLTRGQHDENIQQSLSILDNADAALADATELVRESKTIASSQVGVGSDKDTRANQAAIVASQVDALVDIANRQFNQMSLFGGDRGAAPGEDVFEQFLGGVRYKGGTQNLNADVGATQYQPFTSNGLDAFGALSSRVKTEVDLQPQATNATKISEVYGTGNAGVHKGSIEVTVNGTAVVVDLTNADTLGDVATRVNDAIAGVLPGAGSLAVSGGGFQLSSTAGNTVSIAEVGAGKTAGDLGISLTSTGGVAATGPGIGPKLTMTTRLADLGAAVDWASGLSITQGEQTKVADFSAAQTVEDVVNVIEDLGLGLRMEINADGSGLDLVSEVSGIELSVGENGGTTATDLGIRTFGPNTSLADFRNGQGVMNIEGKPEFEVSLHDGRSFEVDLDGVTTVDQLVTTVQNAATAAGLTLGVDFDVDMKSVGNGLVFTDNTAGAGEFRIDNLGESLAADHLGIKVNAGAAATITGDDNAKVRAESIFTHLMDLKNALANDNTTGITLAGSRIEEDLAQLATSHADVGVNAKRLESQQERSEDLKLSEESMLSTLQDADLAEVITRFTQLQQQMQASMQVGAQNLQLSLLDFLR